MCFGKGKKRFIVHSSTDDDDDDDDDSRILYIYIDVCVFDVLQLIIQINQCKLVIEMIDKL